MADDDEDDRLLAMEAFEAARVPLELRFVADGEELLRYVRREGIYRDPTFSPTPCLILLDLNMPRLSGHEVLAALKADPILKSIEVVVLTTSSAESDIAKAYHLGASQFFTKPVDFAALVELARRVRGLAEAQLARVDSVS
jgi:two-component system response regulator